MTNNHRGSNKTEPRSLNSNDQRLESQGEMDRQTLRAASGDRVGLRTTQDAKTAAGSRFAGKRWQAIALEQLKTRRTEVIVYAGGYFEIFETLSFVYFVLNLNNSSNALTPLAG